MGAVQTFFKTVFGFIDTFLYYITHHETFKIHIKQVIEIMNDSAKYKEIMIPNVIDKYPFFARKSQKYLRYLEDKERVKKSKMHYEGVFRGNLFKKINIDLDDIQCPLK